jgi:putative transcriptional regulator
MLNTYMSYKNNLLVSLPSVVDNSFNKSVIYVNNHTGDGASGWIINKQLDDNIAANLRKGMKLNVNVPIYYGGPVNITQAFVLHSNDLQLPQTVKLTDTLSVTRDRSIIGVFNAGQFPANWKIIVGESSWGAGQLESELLGSRSGGISSWATVPFNTDLVWNTNFSDMWDAGIRTSASQLTSTVLNF